MKSRWVAWLVMAVLMFLLSACTGNKPVLEQMPEDGTGKLKIMYYDEESFYRQYGNYFAIKYPHLEIEVISNSSLYDFIGNESESVDPVKKLSEYIDKEQPDVIMTDLSHMNKLVNEGKLYNMDAIIQQEQYNTDEFLPGLIDMLREQGNGGLYGLAPTYSTQVMFYNADLFKQYQIDPPTNQMSWNDMLKLAARFGALSTEKEQIYGISNEDREPILFLMDIAQTNNLQMLDPSGEKVLLDTPAWHEVFEMVAKSFSNNAIEKPPSSVDGSESSDPTTGTSRSIVLGETSFIRGQAAMSMERSTMIRELDKRFRWNKQLQPFAWEMVTMPVDPSHSDESSYITVYDVFAINQNSDNKRAAWELIKFINGPEMAKASSKMFSGQLPTRVSYLKEIDGKNTEALTKLKPKYEVDHLNDILDKNNVSFDFNAQISTGVRQALEDIIGGKTVDEVLSPLVVQLQQQLSLAKQKGNDSESSGTNGVAVPGGIAVP